MCCRSGWLLSEVQHVHRLQGLARLFFFFSLIILCGLYFLINVKSVSAWRFAADVTYELPMCAVFFYYFFLLLIVDCCGHISHLCHNKSQETVKGTKGQSFTFQIIYPEIVFHMNGVFTLQRWLTFITYFDHFNVDLSSFLCLM